MTICEWNPKPKSEVGGRQEQHEDSGFDFFQPTTTTQDSTHPIKKKAKRDDLENSNLSGTQGFENGSTHVSHVIVCNVGTHLCDKP
jgi:hypothetical protein